MEKQVPGWIKLLFQAARDLLGIGGVEWHITINMTPSPDGDHNNDGSAKTDWIYRNAEVELSCYLEPGEKSWSIILHEAMHLSHAGVEYAVGSILGQVSPNDQEYFKSLYQDSVEQFIQVSSRNLAAAIPFDPNPKEGEDLTPD